MTLDEAIKHCLEVAEQNDAQAEKWREEGGEQWGKTTACRECAADHRQLAEWLKELKELRSLKIDYVFFKAEAKKLLRAAVEDFSDMYNHIFDCDGKCDTCPLHGERDYCLKWRYTDEALALIGEDGDTE